MEKKTLTSVKSGVHAKVLMGILIVCSIIVIGAFGVSSYFAAFNPFAQSTVNLIRINVMSPNSIVLDPKSDVSVYASWNTGLSLSNFKVELCGVACKEVLSGPSSRFLYNKEGKLFYYLGNFVVDSLNTKIGKYYLKVTGTSPSLKSMQGISKAFYIAKLGSPIATLNVYDPGKNIFRVSRTNREVTLHYHLLNNANNCVLTTEKEGIVWVVYPDINWGALSGEGKKKYIEKSAVGTYYHTLKCANNYGTTISNFVKIEVY